MINRLPIGLQFIARWLCYCGIALGTVELVLALGRTFYPYFGPGSGAFIVVTLIFAGITTFNRRK